MAKRWHFANSHLNPVWAYLFSSRSSIQDQKLDPFLKKQLKTFQAQITHYNAKMKVVNWRSNTFIPYFVAQISNFCTIRGQL